MTAVIPKSTVATKKPRVVVYLSEELRNKLERLAESRNRSVSNLLETLTKREIEQAEAAGEINDASN